MTQVWAQAALWLGLALTATLLSIRFRIATALSEIIVGTVAQLIIGAVIGTAILGADDSWVKFLSGTGAVVLTFLAGAELDPEVFKAKWKESIWLGTVAFFAPFLGCAAVAYFVLHWEPRASWLAGIALSTTSVAVVYAVMLELGLNRTDYGKGLLAACFINDLGTVVLFPIIYWVTPRFFQRFGNRPSELEAKYLLLLLFALGALATWADSEAVLPAYLVGMVLAGTVGKDHVLVRRLRTLTFGLLTPFYFIRAGSLVSVPALISAPLTGLVLLIAKMITKSLGVYPTTKALKYGQQEAMYTTLLMSTGLTFGTISALFGLSHEIIARDQYSHLVFAVIASAVIPTVIANAFYLPRYLLPNQAPVEGVETEIGIPQSEPVSVPGEAAISQRTP
jgi:glutathione-regulated potassium-efflux system ancillary protein KefC